MDWSLIIAALIAAVPPTVVAWLAFRQSKITHREVNGKMKKLLELTETSSKAEGVEQERARQEQAK